METVLKIFSPAWLKARVSWSNNRNRKNLKDYPIVEKAPMTPKGLETVAKNYFKRFEYTYDGPDEAFDSMRFPAQCYFDLQRGKLKDDCDGFHAAMYHVAAKLGMNCFLLTYMCKDVSYSHTVLVFKYASRWYKIDYDTLSHASTLKQLMTRTDIVAYNLVKFNYSTAKWYIAKETD